MPFHQPLQAGQEIWIWIVIFFDDEGHVTAWGPYSKDDAQSLARKFGEESTDISAVACQLRAPPDPNH